jgi:hypothetical protein
MMFVVLCCVVLLIQDNIHFTHSANKGKGKYFFFVTGEHSDMQNHVT